MDREEGPEGRGIYVCVVSQACHDLSQRGMTLSIPQATAAASGEDKRGCSMGAYEALLLAWRVTAGINVPALISEPCMEWGLGSVLA